MSVREWLVYFLRCRAESLLVFSRGASNEGARKKKCRERTDKSDRAACLSKITSTGREYRVSSFEEKFAYNSCDYFKYIEHSRVYGL